MGKNTYKRKPKPKGKREFRKCLKCGEQFSSYSVGNRICYGCKKMNRGVSPFEDDYAVAKVV